MSRFSRIAAIVSLLSFSAGHALAQATSDAPVARPQQAVASPHVTPPPAAYAPRASAQSRRSSGFRQHDGFFLRLRAGAGIGATNYRERASDGNGAVGTRTVGSSAQTEVALGYAVVEDLILHATLSLEHVTGAKKVGSADFVEDDTSTLLGFLGVGLTYYLMPTNVYLTGSIGSGGLSQTRGHRHEDFESDTGFGTSVAVGKEWWLGRSGQWAIGVAITGSYYQAPFEVDGVKSQYRGYSSGLSFSTTYN
jgi:hypothetical protein